MEIHLVGEHKNNGKMNAFLDTLIDSDFTHHPDFKGLLAGIHHVHLYPQKLKDNEDPDSSITDPIVDKDFPNQMHISFPENDDDFDTMKQKLLNAMRLAKIVWLPSSPKFLEKNKEILDKTLAPYEAYRRQYPQDYYIDTSPTLLHSHIGLRVRPEEPYDPLVYNHDTYKLPVHEYYKHMNKYYPADLTETISNYIKHITQPVLTPNSFRRLSLLS
jgi:hypothetical protein